MLHAFELASTCRNCTQGLNYRDHTEAGGGHVPKEPLIFNKFGSSLIGCKDNIRQCVTNPAEQMLDWEVEQIVVIGKEANCVAAADAWNYVGGYMAGTTPPIPPLTTSHG
jgi:2-keto-4-pentenoate hydratase/2-oxohepta-3-ene-1,7-dioic acid hydratase in catechol pathway